MLRVGAISMAVALALAVVTALFISFRSEPPTQAAPRPVAEKTVEPETTSDPGDEKPETSPAVPNDESGSASAVPNDEQGTAPATRNDETETAPAARNNEPKNAPAAGNDEPENASAARNDEPERTTRREERQPRGEAAEARTAGLPLSEEGWQQPSGEDLAAANGPRRYAPVEGTALTLTIPSLDVYDVPVFDSDSQAALDSGIAHVPETSMPWDGGAQRNVYLAAHRVGYEGTRSRLVFYYLNRLGRGDEVVLKGRGETYRYRVSETLVVPPGASWVMGQVRGRDMVSLQTCTPIPTFEKRLVVRADRI